LLHFQNSNRINKLKKKKIYIYEKATSWEFTGLPLGNSLSVGAVLASALLLKQKSSITPLPQCAVVGQMVSSHFTDRSCRVLQLARIEIVVSISSNEKAHFIRHNIFLARLCLLNKQK
jgi:hypothetical protein